MRHETVFKPRTTETNFAGHISNTVLPVWYEEACQDFFLQHLSDAVFPYLMVRMDQLFKREIFHGADVVVKTGVKKIGTTSMTLHQEVWQNGAMTAEATSVIVNISNTINKPVPISKNICQCLSAYQIKP